MPSSDEQRIISVFCMDILHACEKVQLYRIKSKEQLRVYIGGYKTHDGMELKETEPEELMHNTVVDARYTMENWCCVNETLMVKEAISMPAHQCMES